MENVFLKPALGADKKPVVVPDPETHRPLKAEGEFKPLTAYWVRRIRDKDVTQSEPQAQPVARAAPPANDLATAKAIASKA